MCGINNHYELMNHFPAQSTLHAHGFVLQQTDTFYILKKRFHSTYTPFL